MAKDSQMLAQHYLRQMTFMGRSTPFGPYLDKNGMNMAVLEMAGGLLLPEIFLELVGK